MNIWVNLEPLHYYANKRFPSTVFHFSPSLSGDRGVLSSGVQTATLQ